MLSASGQASSSLVFRFTVSDADQTVRADGLLRLLSLGVRRGDRVTVTCTGDNEMAATVAMQSYFWNHL